MTNKKWNFPIGLNEVFVLKAAVLIKQNAIHRNKAFGIVKIKHDTVREREKQKHQLILVMKCSLKLVTHSVNESVIQVLFQILCFIIILLTLS